MMMEVVLVDRDKFLKALDKSIEKAEQIVDDPDDDPDYWTGYRDALRHVKELFESI
jgi:hypothetical protein